MRLGLVGGTGFIGAALALRLAGLGYEVVIISRREPVKAMHGIEWHKADTAEVDQLKDALENCDVAVHLVAMLAERGLSFDEVMHMGAQRVAEAAKAVGVRRMVYVSALGIEKSDSRYAQAKLKAEAAVRKVFKGAVMVRPSIVIGDHGGFRQQVDLLTKWGLVMVLPGGGGTLFQPIMLEELVNVLVKACTDAMLDGQTLEAVGEDIVTFDELARAELKRLGRKRLMLPLTWGITWLVAYGFAWLDKVTKYKLIPSWLLVTPDQVRLLKVDNVA